MDVLLDQIDTLGTEIEDPNLKALTADFAQQAQQMVAAVPPEDEDGLEEARIDFRDGAALDLATRCPSGERAVRVVDTGIDSVRNCR